MTSLWVIIRSEETEPDSDYDPDYPTVCGAYASKREAIEEILKLYIEDDIDLFSEKPSDKEDNTEEDNQEYFDYRPTVEDIKEQRKLLLEGDIYNTYTNRGNLYTLIKCVLGAKHEFEEDVLGLYEQSLL